MPVRRIKTYGLGDTPAADTVTIDNPIGRQAVEPDIVVPALSAVIGGILGGAAGAAVLSALELVGFWLAWGVLGASCAAWIWFVEKDAARATLWRTDFIVDETAPSSSKPSGESFALEPYSGQDQGGPDDDHVILINPARGREQAADDERNRLRAEFARFVIGCQRDTSLRRWEKRIGRDKYALFRDALIGAGYARWNGAGKSSGWSLICPPETAIKGAGETVPALPAPKESA